MGHRALWGWRGDNPRHANQGRKPLPSNPGIVEAAVPYPIDGLGARQFGHSGQMRPLNEGANTLDSRRISETGLFTNKQINQIVSEKCGK